MRTKIKGLIAAACLLCLPLSLRAKGICERLVTALDLTKVTSPVPGEWHFYRGDKRLEPDYDYDGNQRQPQLALLEAAEKLGKAAQAAAIEEGNENWRRWVEYINADPIRRAQHQQEIDEANATYDAARKTKKEQAEEAHKLAVKASYWAQQIEVSFWKEDPGASLWLSVEVQLQYHTDHKLTVPLVVIDPDRVGFIPEGLPIVEQERGPWKRYYLPFSRHSHECGRTHLDIVRSGNACIPQAIVSAWKATHQK